MKDSIEFREVGPLKKSMAKWTSWHGDLKVMALEGMRKHETSSGHRDLEIWKLQSW